MRFGFGSRRARSRRPAKAAAPFPPIAGWETTAGRWRHAGAAGWVLCAANEPRGYVDGSGALLGYLIEGAETFYSAPWHDGAAPHLTTSPAYLAKTVAADTVTYAGGHGEADIHGGTGKGVVITQSSTANGIFTASNVKAVAASTNDIVRSEMLFSIPVANGVGGTIAVRNSQNRGVTLNYDANGDVTGWNAVPSNTTYRAGYAEAGVRSNGARAWFVWFEAKALSTGNVSPALGLGAAIAGRKVMVHDLRIVLNPQTAAKAVPVLAENRTFAADRLLTGRTDTIGVLFHRLGRCRTRITDGKLSVATTWARSGPPIPYETRVEIVASTEAADVPGILPNETQDIDFTPWLTPANFSLVLGPGYYNQRVSVTTGAGCVNMTITSAFRNDPLLLAQIERLYTSGAFLTGNLTVDDMIVFRRASEFTTQFEQVDLLLGSSALNNIDIGGSFSAQRCLFVSHPASHSRARAEVQEDDTDNQRVYMGVNNLTTGGTGVTCNISNSHFWRVGRAFNVNTTGMANTLSINADDCFYDQIWSDALYWAVGTMTATFHRSLFGRFTAAESTLYQSRKQIEVDTGSGWQDLSAAGLTVADLPLGRRARHAGTWNFATGTFTAAPVAGRSLIVRAWKRGSSLSWDKPGYQWHASRADHGADMRLVPAGDVYVIEQSGGPSPARPWIRLTFDLGSWTNATTYATSVNPALLGTGTHADTCQVNRTGCTMVSLAADDVVILGDAQGPFLTGNTGLAAGDSDIRAVAFNRWFIATRQSWALEFDYSKTPGSVCSLSNALILPMDTPFRSGGGDAGDPCRIRAAGANNTVALANVHLGYAGAQPVLTTAGGTISGTLATQVPVGRISGYAVIPPSGTPSIEEFLAPGWMAPSWKVRADIDPLDTRFGFTAQAESMTGIGLNAILAAARGTHARWNAVKNRIARYHRTPNHVISVAASAPVGSVVLAGLKAKGWRPLWSGAEKGYFRIQDGEMRVAKSLAGLNQVWLLQTDDDKTILVDIQ